MIKKKEIENKIEPYNSFLTFKFLNSELQSMENYFKAHEVLFLLLAGVSLILLLSVCLFKCIFATTKRKSSINEDTITLKGRIYDTDENHHENPHWFSNTSLFK